TAVNTCARTIYTPLESQETHQLSVTVSYTDDDGNPYSQTSNAVVVGEDPAASVTVTAATLTSAAENVTLSAPALGASVSDTENGAAALSYQWKLDGNPISGANGSSYTPLESQETHQL